jgi:hypothetical protein
LPKQPTPSATPAKAGTGKKWEAEADRKKREAGERAAAAKPPVDDRGFERYLQKQEGDRAKRLTETGRADRKSWSDYTLGTLEDGTPVAFKVGIDGTVTDQVLIADLDLDVDEFSEKEFDEPENHNHYGERREAPGERFAKDEGAYTGPDH